jgi:hypothetical protein
VLAESPAFIAEHQAKIQTYETLMLLIIFSRLQGHISSQRMVVEFAPFYTIIPKVSQLRSH